MTESRTAEIIFADSIQRIKSSPIADILDESTLLFHQIADWQRRGETVALATVIRTWGSSPRAVGSHLAVNESGAFVGSVSGGCIEAAVIAAALQVMADGVSCLLDFNIADQQAWDVGLSCGGRVQIYVEKMHGFKCQLFERVRALYEKKQEVAIITRLSDGAQALVHPSEKQPSSLLDTDQAVRDTVTALRTGRSGLLSASKDLFVRVYPCAANLFVIGAVHIAQCLAPMAKQVGFALTVIDPRFAFATKDRFAGIALNTDWPDAALQQAQLTAADAVVTLTHDPKLDDAALAVALRSPAFYIGALGSKRSHVQRATRLRALGLDAELHRIHAPIGLELGGRTPAEIAVAILAELIQQRYCA